MGKKKWAEKYGEDFQEKINAWKRKHEKVHYIETEDGKEVFLKKPNVQIVAMAMRSGANSPLALIEVLLKNCWLEGDEEIKDDAGCLVGLAEHVDTIIGTKTTTLEKVKKDNNLNSEYQEKIESWKKKYDKIFHIQTEDGKEAFLRSPTRSVVGIAMSKSRKSPIFLIQELVVKCWLEGDEIIKEDPGYLVGLSEHVDKIIQTKNAKIKNL